MIVGGKHFRVNPSRSTIDLAESLKQMVAMPPTRKEAKVLGSWKEIAAYLGKGVRTVQRWEHEFGLPVKRPQKAAKSYVLSSTEELDQWVATKWMQLQSRKESPPNAGSFNEIEASIGDFRRLRQETRELSRDLRHAMEELRGESNALAHTLSRSRESVQNSRKAGFPSSARKRS